MDSDDDAMTRKSPSMKALKNRNQAAATITDVLEIEKEFEGANDRGLVLLWGAIIEAQVRYCVPFRMRKPLSSAIRDALFEDAGAPLETFSANIIIGFAFGAFGRQTFHDLDVIRGLRNEFAHASKPLKFAIPEVAAVCKTLILPDLEISLVPSSLLRSPSRFGKPIDKSEPKTRFIITCHTIIMSLARCYDQIQDSVLREEAILKLLP